MFTCEKYTYDFTAHRLTTFAISTRFVFSPFFTSTSWLLNLTNTFRNGYALACSTACLTVAELNEMSAYGSVP